MSSRRNFGPVSSDGVPIRAGQRVSVRVKQTSGDTQMVHRFKFGIAQLEPEGTGPGSLPEFGGGDVDDPGVDVGVLVGTAEGGVYRYDTDGSPLGDFSVPDSPVRRVEPHTDGQHVYIAYGNRVARYDLDASPIGFDGRDDFGATGTGAYRQLAYDPVTDRVYAGRSNWMFAADPETVDQILNADGWGSATNPGIEVDNANGRLLWVVTDSSTRGVWATPLDTFDPATRVVETSGSQSTVHAVAGSTDVVHGGTGSPAGFTRSRTSDGTQVANDDSHLIVHSRRSRVDDDLFFAIAFDGTVVQYDADCIEQWSDATLVDGSTETGVGLAASADGGLWVARIDNDGNGQLYKYDSAGSVVVGPVAVGGEPRACAVLPEAA